MKRDMGILQRVLSEIEGSDEGNVYLRREDPTGYYHALLAADEKLLIVADADVACVAVARLTNRGHDVLDRLRGGYNA